MRQTQTRKCRPAQRPWFDRLLPEPLPPDPRDPDVVRAKRIARRRD